MADPSPYRDTDDDTGRPATGMPRWVKVFLIIAIVLILGFIITRILGVQHGPGLHTPPGGDHTSSPELGVE
jgi:hypothetical protein